MDGTERPPLPRHRALDAIDGALALVAILLVVQMWLLTATLEAVLGGHPETAGPGAIASALLFLGCFVLYLFVLRVDAEVRR